MVNRELRKALLTKLRISKQALSQKAKRVKELYGPMTTEEAIYIIAHVEGIDISKHLPLSVIDRVRSLIPRAKPSTFIDLKKPLSKKKINKSRMVSYPLISVELSEQSYNLGKDVYPYLFQLENSIRFLIEEILSKHGEDWWLTRVPSKVQNSVQGIINKEKLYPYRERRGAHELFYANFDDLKKIIIHPPNQEEFVKIIIDLDWFKAKMEEVYMARNNLAHCILISPDDITRIMLFHRDWARLLESAGISNNQLQERPVS